MDVKRNCLYAIRLPCLHRSRNLQCQRIFQVNAPINCVCLHPNQVKQLANIDWKTLTYLFITLPWDISSLISCSLALPIWFCSFKAELIVGDQSGVIHIWDLKTDHNEQLIPEPEVSVNSVHIDPDASYMAAVNSSVSPATQYLRLIFYFILMVNCELIKMFLFSSGTCVNRETATCGTSLEESEKRWLRWFPRLRSQHITATLFAASLVQTRREC